MINLVIVCEDEFGIEILSIIEEINRWHHRSYKENKYNILGAVGIHEFDFRQFPSSLKFLGVISEQKPSQAEKYVIAIKDPIKKIAAVNILKSKGANFATIRAPWTLALDFEIGEGSVIAAYSAKDGLKVGKFVTVIAAMISGHEIGDYSTVMRFSNIAGDRIGERVYVGNHSFLAVGKNIGNDSYVEDGSIIVKEVQQGSFIAGVPARKTRCKIR